MKKFLAFLLFAVIACDAVEDFDLKGFLDGIIDWLKEKGLYDTLINWGKEEAVKLCTKWLSESTCQIAVNILASLIPS